MIASPRNCVTAIPSTDAGCRKTTEDLDALDSKLSKKNDWGDVEHLAFIESQLKQISLCTFVFIRLGITL